jgi:hypothetical protein
VQVFFEYIALHNWRSYMNKFSVDYDQLAQSLERSESRIHRLDDVKDKIEKVAFNVVRFRDNSDIDDLWEIKNTDDGPVIVALYDKSQEQVSDGDWSTVPDIKTASLHVFYKGDPIVRLAAEDLNIPDDEISLVSHWLPKKLANDHQTRAYVLSFVGPLGIENIKSEYPELRKSASASSLVPIKTKLNLAKVASLIKGE